MTYQETLNFLYNQLPMYQREGQTAYKKDIGNIVQLCTLLNQPHQKFKSIHIGGTNGKGSVSNMLSSVFMEAGFKVGTYTSPHYLDFRERIKINGEYVSKDFIVHFVKKITPYLKTIRPSFFEITVAMAFDYFATQAVDIAIIEVGLGGRLDSTNIITPELSIITNISFDHQQFLGNTLKKIASEKAGIIKARVPIVIGKTQRETKPIFEKKAKEKHSKILFADQFANSQKNGNFIQLTSPNNGITFTSTLNGAYQLENLTTAFTAFHILSEKWRLTISDFKRGIQHLSINYPLIGRWQILGKHPLTIADSCHNIDGINRFLEELNSINAGKLHLIYGTVSDKDVEQIISLFPDQALYYLTEPKVPRKMPVNKLATFFKDKKKFTTHLTAKEAINQAQTRAKPSDTIALFGSIFLVADVLDTAKNKGS